jgi:large subunit ribosomal protein L15
MPLARRLPKRGFNNSNYEKGFQIVKVGDLNKFDAESVVDYQALLDRGLVSRKCRFVKLLAGGELDRKLTVKVDKVSAQALKQVEKSGGSVEILKVREK